MNNKVRLYQASTRNRVFHKVEGSAKRRRFLRGKQGNWFDETSIVVASDETEARELVQKNIASRKVIGKPSYRQDGLDREIQIKKIEELV